MTITTDTRNEYIPLLGELQLTWPNLQLWCFCSEEVHFILASILGRSTSTCTRKEKVWRTSIANAQNITLSNTNIIGNLQVYKFHCKPVSEHCIRHFDCFTEEPRASLVLSAQKNYSYAYRRCIFLGHSRIYSSKLVNRISLVIKVIRLTREAATEACVLNLPLLRWEYR